MSKDSTRLCIALLVASALWFFMFSPWTGRFSNFWLNMSLSAVILSSMAIPWSGIRVGRPDVKSFLMQLLIGIAIAVTLWAIFWIGDKVSQMIFPFARNQVDGVYTMKNGTDAGIILVLLLFLIGPAEEFFWRGFVQKSLAERIGLDPALIVTTLIYALVHIWSFNFMLVMAALVAGAVWGMIYRYKPSLLPALIVSHALWDALVFVVFPI